jgi:hypothetical protein
MELETVAKVVFIVFVVVLFVYIVVANKDVKKQTMEKFSEEQTPTTPTATSTKKDGKKKQKPLQERIKAIYIELFTMPATKEEIEFYVRFFKNKTEPSDQYLQEVISISAPTLKKTLQVGQPITKNNLADGTEDEVLVIFNEILNRNPTPEELEFYSKMIKKGPAQVEKMKILLLQSQEYRMLQKLQTNKTNALTLRGVTDRQVTFTVTKIYKSMARTDDDIDEETLAFLKKKYIEFNMDDEMFKKFVKSMLSFKGASPYQQSSSASSNKNNNQTSTDSSGSEQRKRANDSVTNKLEDKAFSNNGENKQKGGKNSNSVDTSKMMCEIQQNAKLQFPRNSETMLSSEINNRNRDELRQICARNQRFSKFTDNDMVLLKDQSWSVPQRHPPVCVGGDTKFNPLMTQSSLIGTLLE